MKLLVSVIVLLGLCDPGWTGSVNACYWEEKLNPKQGLDPNQGVEGQVRTEWRLNVSNMTECRKQCCQTADCDLALLGLPLDGPAQCALVRCPTRGCRLKPSNQFQVSRRLKVTAYLEPRTSEDRTSEDRAGRCSLPKQVGRCRAAFPRFYYDATTQTCRRFTYGGCGGNDNNFLSEEACQALCGGVTGSEETRPESPENQGAKTLPASNKAVTPSPQCSGAPDPGPCRAAFTMFYYDPVGATCRAFVYGGCHGNMNRHNSLEDCLSHCADEGSMDGRGLARTRWTSAFFLLLILAGTSALVVVALIAITVRRRLPRRRPSHSDKEELLQDEPSLDSPTVPTANGNA